MNLFYIGESNEFTQSITYDLKMNLDALCDDDIKALAKYIIKKHKFKDVFAVSPKVKRLAVAILEYATEDVEDYMLLDDVLKTGDTLIYEKVRLSQQLQIGDGQFFGVVIFSKMPIDDIPDWIDPLFRM